MCRQVMTDTFGILCIQNLIQLQIIVVMDFHIAMFERKTEKSLNNQQGQGGRLTQTQNRYRFCKSYP